MTDQIKEARERLREAAEKATPGPWNMSRTHRYVKEGIGAPWVCEVDCGNKRWEANAEFIALANPATILALLSHIDDQDALLADVKEAAAAVRLFAQDSIDQDPHPRAVLGNLFGIRDTVDTLSDKLKAGGAELCGDCPPADYPTDKTRCTPCPRRAALSGDQ